VRWRRRPGRSFSARPRGLRLQAKDGDRLAHSDRHGPSDHHADSNGEGLGPAADGHGHENGDGARPSRAGSSSVSFVRRLRFWWRPVLLRERRQESRDGAFSQPTQRFAGRTTATCSPCSGSESTVRGIPAQARFPPATTRTCRSTLSVTGPWPSLPDRSAPRWSVLPTGLAMPTSECSHSPDHRSSHRRRTESGVTSGAQSAAISGARLTPHGHDSEPCVQPGRRLPSCC